MRYGSVCSGIEAASLAWESLGWQPAWFAEIEKFPSSVLAARWPGVVNLGDMCALPDFLRSGMLEAPDILVGGTPCQAYSVAGKREGLADERGQLTLKFVEVADAIDSQRPADPCIVVWENVPGVLSDKTNAFGCFLGDLVGEDVALEPPGGKWSNAGIVHGPRRTAAWRVLDAQYFGVAQRRRRVFVVASAREGFNPATVLFESEGVRRDSAPSRETGSSVAALTANGVGTCGADDNQGQAGHLICEEVAATLKGGSGERGWTADDGAPLVCMAHGQAGAEIRSEGEPSLTCNHEAPIIFNWNAQPDQMNFSSDTTPTLTRSQEAAVCQYGDVAGSLTARHDSSPCADRGMNVLAFSCKDSGADAVNDIAPTMRAMGHSGSHANAGGQLAVSSGLTVRRLMPVECERLQGMPDNHTLITPNTTDGPRYKAIGNSKAVPVVRWIGRRIQRAVRP